jgi:N-acetylglucosamine-6-phosphate deacetylase
MRIRARHYRTGDPVDICTSCDSIETITAADPSHPADLSGEYVAPALFDLQINGCHGNAFSSPQLTVDQVNEVTRACWRHGISHYLPTLVTNSYEALAHGFATLARARETSPQMARSMVGFHLEGPYISPEDGPRGAHARQHVRPPDWEEFLRLQESARGLIRLVTLAPEWPGATWFIERLVQSGVVVALGHTAATPAQVREGVAAGARLSTHLGNGSHAMLPRHENYLWEQLADDRLWASLITDGFHLPRAVVRCVVRVKTPARIILTCDASSLAGSPPGRYREWDQEFEVCADGRVIVPGTPFLAGSGVFTDDCLSKVIDFAGVSLADAIDMAGARPRELLGYPAVALEAGAPADLVLFSWQPGGRVRITATIIGGAAVSRLT